MKYNQPTNNTGKLKTAEEVYMQQQKKHPMQFGCYTLPEQWQLDAMHEYAAQFQPPTPVTASEGIEQAAEAYNVCHICQLHGLRNCNEFDVCLNTKSYPKYLRKMVEQQYSVKTSLSIIAEKAFDLGQASQPNPVIAIIEGRMKELEDELYSGILSYSDNRENEICIAELERLLKLITPNK
jgi:hypothetical protein